MQEKITIKKDRIICKLDNPKKGWFLIKGHLELKGSNCNGLLTIKYINGSSKHVKLPISKRGIINYIFNTEEKISEIEISLCKESFNKLINFTFRKLYFPEVLIRMYRRIIPLFLDKNLPNIEILNYTGITFLKALLNPISSYYKISYARFDRTCEILDYQDWLNRYDKDIIANQTKENLKIGLIIPIFTSSDINLINKTINSINKQIYKNWMIYIFVLNKEIKENLEKYENKNVKIINDTIKLAKNIDYYGVIFPGDEIHKSALSCLVYELNKRNFSIIYTDSDFKKNNIRKNPLFKPEFSYDYLLSYDYIKNLVLFRTSLLKDINFFNFKLEEYCIYDAILRSLSRINTRKDIKRIAKILYHHHKDKSLLSWEKGLEVLKDFLKRQKLNVSVEKGDIPHTFRIKYNLTQEPLVSIIIPTKDKKDFLSKCISSILEKTKYRNYEILIIDNGSKNPETLNYLANLQTNKKIRVIKYDVPFNFSKIINFAVKQTHGEFICILNNDTEVINKYWLSEIVAYLKIKDIGVVGAKLFYSNNKVQHAGVIVGLWGAADHAFKGLCKNQEGYMYRAVLPQNYLAVTAACMGFRKEIFYKVNGFNEEDFPISFNDVDFCIRVWEKGYRIVFNPKIELFHYEHGTRKKGNKKEELVKFRKKWKKYILDDPFYNPNLGLYRNDFGFWYPRKHYCF